MSEPTTRIQIHILPKTADNPVYPVEAELDDGSYFSGGQLKLDFQNLLTLALDAPAYGQALEQALFTGPILRAYQRVSGRAEAQSAGCVRVQLWIADEASELHALPWERLYHLYKDQNVALATSDLTPFSRYTGLEVAEVQPLQVDCLRILFAAANPENLPPGFTPVDVEQEVKNLLQALSQLPRADLVQIDFLPGRTGLSDQLVHTLQAAGHRLLSGSTSLENIVRSLEGCQVLHFVGHGIFKRGAADPNETSAFLYLEDDQGQFRPARDSDIVARLAQADPLPYLVFLSACESAQRDPGAAHPFLGLAPKLVKAGVPAVVAMQDVVPVDVAQQLTGDFYRLVLQHGEVDRAMNHARLLLFDNRRADWSIPVLYMRLKSGQLFTPDPLRAALEAMRDGVRREMEKRGYMPIPIEVAHLTGDLNLERLVTLEQEPLPAQDLVATLLQIFADSRARANQANSTIRGGVFSARGGPFAIVTGIPGSSKSTQLRRLVKVTAEESLKPGVKRPTLPVYLDLRSYASVQAAAGSRMEAMLLNGLLPYWPDLTPGVLSALLDSTEGPVLRIILDGGDELPVELRMQAWQEIQNFARGSHHEFVLAVNLDNYAQDYFKAAAHLLVIQPLPPRKVQQFLMGLPDPVGQRLYQVIATKQLYDLAGIPWLLMSMLHQAQEEHYPLSRADVLGQWVTQAASQVSSRYGMRACTLPTLQALALEMQTRRTRALPVQDAFELMSAVRQIREYNLEDLQEELVNNNLLSRVGHDALRFNYPPVQAFACAQALLQLPDCPNRLDDITATLGRLARLRWWEDVLVLVSGLMDDPDELLRMILTGTNLAESEQLYLAARCLLEARGHQILPHLENQVIDTLLRQLDLNNEPRAVRRARAAAMLGQLQRPQTIPALVKAAVSQVRPDWQGNPTYELSNVRMAASIALQSMMARFSTGIHNAHAQLAGLLKLWGQRDVPSLAKALRQEEPGMQAIAAFALGDIGTSPAIQALVEVFLDPDTPPLTSWPVTDSLALVDPLVVTQQAVLPLLEEKVARRRHLDPRTWKGRARYYERLAYLIGKLRIQTPETDHFLQRCLYEFKSIDIKARTIQTLGWLNCLEYKTLFEAIAVGDFTRIALSDKLQPWDITYLQRKAIEALARLGDLDTLSWLRQQRQDWEAELENAFYWTSEEITWRMSPQEVR